MLNVAITILFAVICIFQPWMAVIFGFLWLVEMNYRKTERERQESIQKIQDDFYKKVDVIVEEFNAPEQPERKKVHLRIVK